MSLLIQISIIVHVAAGLGALISGAIAFSLRKNTVRHKPFGKFYFWMMSIVFVTGIFLSVAKSLLFFFFIAVLTYYNTLVAYRALSLKQLHSGQKPKRLDWAIAAIASLAFLGLIGLAVVTYLNNHSTGAIVPFVFGSLGLYVTFRNTMVFIKPPAKSNYWLKIHIGNMMGSYVGAITAFLVNQTDKIPLHPALLWIAPSVLIVPVIMRELRKLKSETFPAKQQ
jgi:uncharacterized membrane protein